MPAIFESPTIVHDAVKELFANEPERRNFAEYLTRLFVVERTSVSGINSEFAETSARPARDLPGPGPQDR